MKKLFSFVSILLSPWILSAQTYCGTPRYDTVVFSNVTVTSNVVYGWNKTLTNAMDTLKMDIYEPTGDVANIRPLIILAHGGSFIGGDKADEPLPYICSELAKHGYVVSSINYRLGIAWPFNQSNAQKAVWRATQDMKAAVRFFRRDADSANIFKVDSNMIFVGGASAGGIMAIHYAYLDQSSEVPSAIDTTTLGGLEGSSCNPGYSSSVKAIINICGALADTSWMQTGDENMVSLQGNWDETVPYCSDTVFLSPPSTFPIMVIHGLGSMVLRANNTGIYNPVHTFYGGDHGSPGDTINIDTTMAFISQFLYKEMGCTSTNTVNYTNPSICVMNIGVNDIALNESTVTLYPNPAIEGLTLMLTEPKEQKLTGEILDITGRKINEFNFSGDHYLIMRNGIQSGIYFLKLKTDSGESFTAKIIFTE